MDNLNLEDMEMKEVEIRELKKRFKNKPYITFDDFKNFYTEFKGDIKEPTVRWLIYNLNNEGIIRNIGRGMYTLVDNEKDNSTSKYIVLNLDIVSSTMYKHTEFDKELKIKVSDINKLLKINLGIKSKFNIAQGDSLQIIYESFYGLGDVLITTLANLYPFKARYGASVGEYTDEILDNSFEMNGPLFWNAKDQLDKVSSFKEYMGSISVGIPKIDEVIENLMPLINKGFERITKKQWEAILSNIKGEDLESILKELEISRSSYFERINVSGINEIKKAFKSIDNLISMEGLL